MTLEIKQVRKRFNQHVAVDGISVSVEKGNMFGMLGANGAGKTTTFRMILGLLEPTEGSITWENKQLSYKNTHLIGYLPEERGLYPKLTVRDQLTYLGKLKGMKAQDIHKEVKQWLKRFQVEEYETKKVEELSKGNQQKIQFIAAVLHKPELLILDEPFSGLDPVNSDMLKNAVRYLQELGTTIVFSSHQMRNVEEMCEDIIMLKRGKAVLQGSLTDIKRGYGIKNVSIHADYDLSFLASDPHVTNLTPIKNGVIARVENEEAAKAVFGRVAEKGFVRKFEVEEPSLHDIFIDQVGGGANE